MSVVSKTEGVLPRGDETFIGDGRDLTVKVAEREDNVIISKVYYADDRRCRPDPGKRLRKRNPGLIGS